MQACGRTEKLATEGRGPRPQTGMAKQRRSASTNNPSGVCGEAYHGRSATRGRKPAEWDTLRQPMSDDEFELEPVGWRPRRIANGSDWTELITLSFCREQLHDCMSCSWYGNCQHHCTPSIAESAKSSVVICQFGPAPTPPGLSPRLR